MRGRAAQVDAVHGGFVAQAFIPQVLGQDLALEDVSTGQSNPLLDVARANDLIV